MTAAPTKITDGIWWVGVQNPDLRIFDVIMRTEWGTSYNSYLIKGSEKIAVEMCIRDSLREGVPLVSGAGDKMAGALGSGAVSPGDMIFEAGSYGEISCCVPDYRPDLQTGRIDCLPSAVPGYFFATKFVAGSGITPVSYTHLDVYKRQVITFE